MPKWPTGGIRHGSARRTSYQIAELFWGIRRVFELMADRRPIVVLVDDIHWAEQTFLDLIDHLASTTHREPRPRRVHCPSRVDRARSHRGAISLARHSLVLDSPVATPTPDGSCEHLLGQARTGAGCPGPDRRRVRGQPAVRRADSCRCSSTAAGLHLDGGGWVATTDLSRPGDPADDPGAAGGPPGSHCRRDEREILEPASVDRLGVPPGRTRGARAHASCAIQFRSTSGC